MSKKQKFIEAVQSALFDVCDPAEMDQDVLEYWEAFKGKNESEKPALQCGFLFGHGAVAAAVFVCAQ